MTLIGIAAMIVQALECCQQAPTINRRNNCGGAGTGDLSGSDR
jgi:hypothetical protein